MARPFGEGHRVFSPGNNANPHLHLAHPRDRHTKISVTHTFLPFGAYNCIAPKERGQTSPPKFQGKFLTFDNGASTFYNRQRLSRFCSLGKDLELPAIGAEKRVKITTAYRIVRAILPRTTCRIKQAPHPESRSISVPAIGLFGLLFAKRYRQALTFNSQRLRRLLQLRRVAAAIEPTFNHTLMALWPQKTLQAPANLLENALRPKLGAGGNPCHFAQGSNFPNREQFGIFLPNAGLAAAGPHLFNPPPRAWGFAFDPNVQRQNTAISRGYGIFYEHTTNEGNTESFGSSPPPTFLSLILRVQTSTQVGGPHALLTQMVL